MTVPTSATLARVVPAAACAAASALSSGRRITGAVAARRVVALGRRAARNVFRTGRPDDASDDLCDDGPVTNVDKARPTTDLDADRRPIGPIGRGLVGALVVAGLGFSWFAAGSVLWSVLWSVLFLGYAGVGAVLAVRRPGNAIGWILLAVAWSFVLVNVTVTATTADLMAGTAAPWEEAKAWLTGWSGSAIFALIALLTVVFPSGRVPDGGWGRVARTALVASAALVLLTAAAPTIAVNPGGSDVSLFVPNPLALFPDAAFWAPFSKSDLTLPLVALMAIGAISVLVRFRRSQGLERQQLRWMMAALTLVPLAVIAGFLLVTGGAPSQVAWIPALVAFMLPPLAVGIAVLRYRLYEIDRIISRTIGWAAVTTVLAVVFVAVILVTQTALASITTSNTFAVAASTLVVAALFQPLRRRVQAKVDRRFNRARYDAERTVAAFAGRLRDELDIEALTTAIAAAVIQTVEPVSVSLWLRE